MAVASGVTYPGNTEFGEPADADASDDFIVRHEQFTASYNPNRGAPELGQLRPRRRALRRRRSLRLLHDGSGPAGLVHAPRLPTTTPTPARSHGYGIDRGHMTRSFDRTTGSLDNARTYLFSNVVPQAADMNQGPWANLENDLGDLARVQGREVYIITGPAGNKGTLKNEGKVVIPTSTWKVAVIMPHDQGLANMRDYRDLEVIAVNMPNEPGIRNVDWNTYRTTVDAIEALTGYDLLALLPDDVEARGRVQHAAAARAPSQVRPAQSPKATRRRSTRPARSIRTARSRATPGTSATAAPAAASASRTPSRRTARSRCALTVTDNDGLTDTATFAVNVTNVAPVVGAVPNGSAERRRYLHGGRHASRIRARTPGPRP